MNAKIIGITNEIILKKEEIKNLEKSLIDEWYSLLEENGIKKGGKILVNTFSSRVEEGILDSLYIKYDEVRPKIMKIKKDGTAHSSATLPCYSMKDIVIENK